MEEIKEGQEIYRGRFSIIKKALYRGDYAIIKIPNIPPNAPTGQRELVCEILLREFEIIKKLKEKGCSYIIDILHPEPIIREYPILIFEYCPKTLRDIIDYGIDEKTALDLIHKITIAIECMHKQRIIHGDLKPENILIDINDTPKIADFNAIPAREKGIKEFYTLEYAPPELIEKEIIDEKTDVWQIGVIMYELIEKKAPIQSR